METYKNIILDLDSTLIFTCEDGKTPMDCSGLDKLEIYTKNHDLRPKIYHFETGYGKDRMISWGMYRPYIRSFVDYCFYNFDNVIVWSAGLEDYVHKICERVFGKNKRCLRQIYSRNDCQIDVDSTYIKKLSCLYEKIGDDNINETNTLIIDDNDLTFRFNQDNAVHIPAFTPRLNRIGSIRNNGDDNLNKLLKWFDREEFWTAPDVRALDKTKIF